MEQRKGKSNAILTYELLASFDQKLTTLVAQFRGLEDSLKDKKGDLADHEARLRVIETRQITSEANSTTTRGWLRDAWVAVFAIAGLVLSLINTMFNTLAHLRAPL